MFVIVHEESYKGASPRSFVHKARLNKIMNLLDVIVTNFGSESEPVWADFGCSNGFMIDLIQRNLINSSRWFFWGFDHNNELLELAKQRNLQNTCFNYLDLNSINKEYANCFDIVTCFETLEHTGGYENPFENLYISCKVNGFIIISIPNEIGVPGVIKFFGRIIRKVDVYKGFFENQSVLKYVLNALMGKEIECFRKKEVSGWGPHLGFDYRCFEKFLKEKYFEEKKCILWIKDNSFFNFGKIYAIKKLK